LSDRRTPLVLRYGALGDMVMTTPALRALAARHGAPCAVAALGGWVPQLFRGLPFVGEIATVRSRKAPYWFSPDQWRLVDFLRRFRGHPVYLLVGDVRSAALAARAGLAATASVFALGTLPNEHQVDNQRRVCGFGADGYDRVPELATSAEELAAARAFLAAEAGAAPVVLVHAGNKKTMGGGWRKRSRNLKHWPVERWVETVRAVLAHQPEARVLLTGSPGEQELVAGIVAACGDPRATSIAGRTGLRQLLGLLRLAHSMISVDTGPAHAAAAVGCPLVVLFGQTDPRTNGPISRSSPVAIVTGPPGAPALDGEAGWAAHHSMDGVAVAQVVAAWKGLGSAQVGP
jgi:heptosyltransferase-2/heptosyltransferase-3